MLSLFKDRTKANEIKWTKQQRLIKMCSLTSEQGVCAVVAWKEKGAGFPMFQWGVIMAVSPYGLWIWVAYEIQNYSSNYSAWILILMPKSNNTSFKAEELKINKYLMFESL